MEAHQRDFADSEWPFRDAANAVAFTTRQVFRGGFPVLLVSHDDDGDWQILCGTTTDTKDLLVVCLGCANQRDKSIGLLLADLSRWGGALRDSDTDPWQRDSRGRVFARGPSEKTS